MSDTRPPAASTSAAPFTVGGEDGFDFGQPPTTPAPATPPAAPAVATPAPRATPAAKAPKAPKPAKAKAKAAPRPAAGPDDDYTAGLNGPRTKDAAGTISAGLLPVISNALDDWAHANRHELRERGLSRPTMSGWREALFRIGLKHLDDPELIDLIPADLRKSKG